MNFYEAIRNKLNLPKALPVTPDWSAAPDFLHLILEHCLTTRPATILECSSGLTTLVLARCCQLNQHGHVWSLENGAEYVDKTQAELAEFGLMEYATVCHAPLEKKIINNVEYLWYAQNAIPNKPIDMLVIDGPPGFIQKHSRYPALPILFDKLADNSVVFLDDAAREDEKEIIALWQAQYPNIEHEYIAAERGCSVLRLNKNHKT